MAQFEARLHHLSTLHAFVTEALPKALRAYCHSVYWSEKTLIINMTNSAVMSKVRQLSPGLVRTLQEKKVDVMVIRPVMFFDQPKPASTKPQKMSPAALQAFQTLKQSVSDPQLKEAITALLAAHTGKT